MSSLRKQYEVSGGLQPAPPCPWGCSSALGCSHLSLSPSPLLCSRWPCRELSAWKPSWNNSESSCRLPNDHHHPAVQGGGRSAQPWMWSWDWTLSSLSTLVFRSLVPVL